MPTYFLTANVGSLGKNNNLHQVNPVMKNLLQLQYQIRGLIGKFADVFGLQETQNDEIRLTPKFDLPFATNSHCTIGYEVDGQWINKRRGVATYSDKNLTKLVPTLDFPKIECTVTLHDYDDYKSGVCMKKILYFNFYRNIHEESDGASINDIISFVRHTMAIYTAQGINDALICGDFNYEKSISFGYGLKEFRDPELYHKHNSSSRHYRIDRIFSNCPSFKIVHVFKTVENKSDYVDDDGNTANDLGHKPYLVRIGRPKVETVSKIFRMNKLKIHSKRNSGNLTANSLPDRPISPAGIDISAKFLIDQSLFLIELSTCEYTKKSSWRPEELATNMLEAAGDCIWW